MCIWMRGTVCRKSGTTVQLWRERWAVMCVGLALRPQAGPSETTWWYFRRMCPQGTMYPEPDGVPRVCSRLRWIPVPPHTGSNLWLLPSSLVLAASLEITRNVPSYSHVFLFVRKLLYYTCDLGWNICSLAGLDRDGFVGWRGGICCSHLHSRTYFGLQFMLKCCQ